MVEYVDVADMDVPAGSGGINRERYTYGELRRRPIIPEVMRGISDSVVRRWAEECNARNRSGFVMRKVNGEYRFDGLHVGSKVKLPSKGGCWRSLGRIRRPRLFGRCRMRCFARRSRGRRGAQLGPQVVPAPRVRQHHPGIGIGYMFMGSGRALCNIMHTTTQHRLHLIQVVADAAIC